MMIFPPRLDEYRFATGDYASNPGDPFGAFLMPGPSGSALRILAASASIDSSLWEHASVSTDRRIPNWIEMSFVKDLFWPPEDCVVQFHPRKSEYVNCHPRCLHLWRWTGGEFPTPPMMLVGPKL